MKHDLTKATEIFFRIGGYFGSFHEVLIRKGEQKTAVCASHHEWGYEADSCSIKPFTESEWNELLLFLTDELHVTDWKDEYINNSNFPR